MMTSVPTSAREPHVIVLSCVTLGIAVGYAELARWQHVHFLTHGHDLGIFAQTMWELSRLRAPATTVRHTPLPNIFGDHFDPVVLSLVPFYRIADSPMLLLVAQALLLAGVVPIGFLVARTLGVSRWPAVILSIALGILPASRRRYGSITIRSRSHPCSCSWSFCSLHVNDGGGSGWRSEPSSSRRKPCRPMPPFSG